MVAGSITLRCIEDKIRELILTKRRRPSAFFIDYDSLRSGYVSDSQFFRCLWVNLALKFSPDEETALKNAYDVKRNGRLCWRDFANSVERNFEDKDLTTDPVTQKVESLEFLGTTKTIRPLSPTSEHKIETALKQMVTYYKYNGINFRTTLEDFDVHHVGRITESQFYRAFPGPPNITEDLMTLLVKKYRDPDEAGLVVYLNLHHDLMAIAQHMERNEMMEMDQGDDTLKSTPAGQQSASDGSVQDIFDKIRVAVFKFGIRTPDFFQQHDRLRSGIVTETQFICGLSLAFGKEAHLSRPEMQKIVEVYRQPGGRVRYKEFCDMLENAFNIPDLDKKATQTPIRPAQGALNRTLIHLSEAEEANLQRVLGQIREQVVKRRLMMYQYFKDYDRSRAYTRVMTILQFRRVLHFLSLNVADEDFKLLCKKFKDEATGDVNYPAFVQCVDQEFVGFTIDSTSGDKPSRPFSGTDGGRLTLSDSAVKPQHKSPGDMPECDTSSVDMASLLAKIRDYVLTNRLRVIEYFQDFDQLRSGCINKNHFRRGLAALGLSKVGHHDLTDPQFTVLCSYYHHPQKADQVLWTKFMDDIESVFTQPNLEKAPTVSVPPQELFRVPKPGTMDWEGASDDHKQLWAETMTRLKTRSVERRVLLKPAFQDFDWHNNGHITRVQFRQALTMLELHATKDEMAALEAKYCNDVGFNYMRFLAELEPPEQQQFRYMERLKDLRKTNDGKRIPELDITTDLEALLLKIKTKVTRERMRVHEWMRDYDKLRTGRMPKLSFRRSLDLCRFELKESEIAMLEDHYQSREDLQCVDWLRFSDEIESIFTTKELEKAPLLHVEQFMAPTDSEKNQMSEAEATECQEAIARLAEKVRARRMQLYPLFEDYDRVHNGLLSRSQFRRVLTELELGSLVTEKECGLIADKFRVLKGLREDVDYPAFCDCVYELCKFEWRKP